jgi:RES domain-containing protein
VKQLLYAWRVTSARRKETALDGVGAALAGGRWNPVGVKMVYCAESLALAVLEVRVHLPIQQQPTAAFVGIELEILEEAIERPSKLPRNWKTAPTRSTEDTAARRFGARWVKEARSVALQLPSAIIPSESLFLLNPEHPDFPKAVKIRRTLPVFFDPRLW